VLHHNQLALTHRADAEAVIGLSCRGSSSVDLEESKEGDNIKNDGSIWVPPAKVREGVDPEELSAVIDCFALLSRKKVTLNHNLHY
jgi:hypothetical protein